MLDEGCEEEPGDLPSASVQPEAMDVAHRGRIVGPPLRWIGQDLGTTITWPDDGRHSGWMPIDALSV
ncbi:MAG: hypothetical protein J4G15_12505 [Alphaproteobacteria bacterium]|nr:hypothetical protein [Alphaproteobacteria bacterium]